MREFHVVDAVELARAYATAEYAVVLDGDALEFRVGAPATDVEAYWPAQRYFFITAWNPASQPQSEAANEAADALLVARLDAAGAPRRAAWSQAPGGEWREPGWLVAELAGPLGEQLAREFGQAGVLAWERGRPVGLCMSIPRPYGAAPVPHVEWAQPKPAPVHGLGAELA